MEGKKHAKHGICENRRLSKQVRMTSYVDIISWKLFHAVTSSPVLVQSSPKGRQGQTL